MYGNVLFPYHFFFFFRTDGYVFGRFPQLMDADLGSSVTINDLLIKACGICVMEFPEMRKQVLSDGSIQEENCSDISVAVATPAGLLTPIIRDAASSSLASISSRMKVFFSFSFFFLSRRQFSVCLFRFELCVNRGRSGSVCPSVILFCLFFFFSKQNQLLICIPVFIL